MLIKSKSLNNLTGKKGISLKLLFFFVYNLIPLNNPYTNLIFKMMRGKRIMLSRKTRFKT